MPGGGPIERLEERMRAALDKHRAETDDELEKLKTRMTTLERWQSWVYGVAAAIAVLAGVAAKGIAKKLGYDFD